MTPDAPPTPADLPYAPPPDVPGHLPPLVPFAPDEPERVPHEDLSTK